MHAASSSAYIQKIITRYEGSSEVMSVSHGNSNGHVHTPSREAIKLYLHFVWSGDDFKFRRSAELLPDCPTSPPIKQHRPGSSPAKKYSH